MYDVLIRNAQILTIDGTTPRLLAQSDLAISAGKIAAIAPQIDPGLARATLDAEGMLLIPGFVNSHAHTAMGYFRGAAEDVAIEPWFNQYIWPMESNLSEEDVYWGAMLGLVEQIEAGITCVADHYFFPEAVTRAFEVSGVRALFAPTIFGGAHGPASLAAASAFVEQNHGRANGRIRVWLGPHAPYTCEPELLAATAQQAKALGVGIHIHLSETAAQVAQSQREHGKSPVALMRDLGLFDVPAIAAHVVAPVDDDLAILAGHGVGVAVCAKTMMKLGVGVAPVEAMRAAGITVGIGSDGAGSNNRYDLLEVARLTALLAKHEARDATVMPVGAALSLGWHEGAKLVGLGQEVGAIEVGYRADLTLLRLDEAHLAPLHDPAAALLYSASASDVDTVIVDGQILMQGRQLRTVDRAQVLREVNARAERLVERTHGRSLQTYRVERS